MKDWLEETLIVLAHSSRTQIAICSWRRLLRG